MALLDVKDLHIWIKDQSDWVKAVNGVSFSIEKGQTFALVGESGCGKTMTANAIMRLLPFGAHYVEPSSICFREKELLDYSEVKMRKVRGSKISMVFQESSLALNPVLTVKKQLLEALPKYLSSSNKQSEALRLLEKVKIPNPKQCLNSYPFELSGGMKQRIIIAMALASKAELIIADEPTTALDVTVQKEILQLLKSLQQQEGLSILFISHNLMVVKEIADHLAVMKDGKIVECATTDAFFSQQNHPYSRKLLASVPKTRSSDHIKKDADVVLKADKISVQFPRKKGFFRRTVDYHIAVDHISLTLKKGQTVAVVGESGSGKTTLAKALLRLEKLQKDGEVFYHQQSYKNMTKNEVRGLRKGLQIVFQDPFSSMNPKLLTQEILAEGLNANGMLKDKEKRKKYLVDLLKQVELDEDILLRYPHEFSGGQRQRIAIARALTVNPDVLLLDEPTSALDVSVQASVLKLLESLQQKRQLSYLFISHDLAVVASLADEVMVIFQGQVVEYGPSLNVFKCPQHPYTQHLIDSIPGNKNFEHNVILDKNNQSDTVTYQREGCLYRHRCQYRQTKCDQHTPQLTSDKHKVRCYYPLNQDRLTGKTDE